MSGREGSGDEWRPRRDQPGVEWSVAVDGRRTSSDRYVLYGLTLDEVAAFLERHGHAPAPLFRRLRDRFGPPFKALVGQDGERFKLYWCFRGHDPCMAALDLIAGREPTPKEYQLLPDQRAGEALDLVAPDLMPALERLLSHPALSAGVSDVVVLRRGTDTLATGADVGLPVDWEAVLAGDAGPLQMELVHSLLDYLGLARRWPGVSEALFDGSLAFTSYVGVRLREDGSVGANIYAFSRPAVRLGEGLAIAAFGGRPWPLLLCFRGRDSDTVFRLRAPDAKPHFERIGDWLLDYRAPAGGPPAVPVAEDRLAAVRRAARLAALAGTPMEPLRALSALRAAPELSAAWLEPDMGAGDSDGA